MRLCDFCMDDKAKEWFRNTLAVRNQSVHTDGHKSSIMEISKGVPQGLVLALIFYFYKLLREMTCSQLKCVFMQKIK